MIVDLPATSDEPERVDANLSVRRDRWVQARLELLRSAATDEDIEVMDRAVRRRFEDSVALKNSDALRSFLGYFGTQPLADEARALLVERITGVAPPLEVEHQLRRLIASDNPERARNAVARLAELLKQNGRLDESGRYVKQLEDWSDVACRDGKTGQQVLDELFKDKPDAAAMFEPLWPTGLVKHEALKSQPTGINRVFAIDLRGPRGPFFEHATVELDQQQQTIAGRDGLGRERWRVSLADRSDHNPYQLNFSLSHARAEGHLLVASLGFQMLAIDTLGSGKSGARILWRKDLTDVLPNMPRQMGNQARMVRMPWGMPQFLANDAFGHPVGTTGAVTPDFVCFQRQRNLTAVHPITGKTLWIRSGVQPGSDIFGDNELLFVTPPNSTEALVVRAADGQELGRRSVPPLEHRLAMLGRKIVVWQMNAGRATLRLRDVWTEQNLWERTFDAGAKVWPVEDQAVGVLQLDGRFSVHDLADGSQLVDAKIKAEPALTEIYVFRTPDRWLLITNRPWSNRDGDNVQPVQGSGASNSLIHGHVYGFDRDGGQLVFTTPIDGRSLTFPQPADLPVLAFAAQVYRQRPGKETAPQVAILCIDKRTGRVAYENRSPIGTVEFRRTCRRSREARGRRSHEPQRRETRVHRRSLAATDD